MESANPVLIEATRGDAVESRHRGAAVVVEAGGAVVAAWGDVSRPVYPRSAIKPLQALPLIESGAAERFAVSDRELALACASHSGEERHVTLAGAWLQRLGLGPEDLACGPHRPIGEAAADNLARADLAPGRLHNNCSGKHTGMLATALHMGEPTAGYEAWDHPVQGRVRAVLAELGDWQEEKAPRGIDGCGVPTVAMPLLALATAFARLAAPDGLGAARAAAARRITAAMWAHPDLVAGSGRLDSAVLDAAQGTVLLKTGAEGVYAAALPRLRLGLALKIDDGAKRASEAVLAALLLRFGDLDGAAAALLAGRAEEPILDTRGETVGVVRAVIPSPQS